MAGLPIPANVDGVTPQWLTAALQERFPGADVAAVEVLDRHEETNSHARLRIAYAQDAGAPATMFCKLLPNSPERRPLIAATGMGPREAQFYADLAPSLSALSPAAYVTAQDGEGGFVLMLEDLVASEGVVTDGTWGMPPDAAARALEDLAELHIRFEDPARRAAEAPWVPVSKPSLAYGGPMLREALERYPERLNATYVEIAQIYLANHAELQALWHAGPHTIIHGDPHLGNLYLDAGRIGFLDWGIINVNTPMRDVSYFLTMAMGTEDRRKHERDLLSHYLDVLRASGAFGFTFDEAWLAHRVHGAYTVAASCGAAAMHDDVTPKRRVFAMGFLALAVAAVEDLESRAALREFGDL
jgi:aminoglycoside phosphotransferase (APT) family kinase protein